MNLRVLHVHTSPLGSASASRALGQALRQQLPADVQVEDLDLATNPVPHWTPAWAGSTEAQAQIEMVLGAHVLILEAPMYNFGIPSTLKAWLDTIAQAGRTFHYTPEGPVGHLTGLKVIIVSSRGGAYGQTHAADFQEAYLRQFLGFLGVTADRLTVIRAEGLAMGEDVKARAMREAQGLAQAAVQAL